MKLDKILVPLDGSELAETALTQAVELMKTAPAATIVLLRATEVTAFAVTDPVAAQVAVVREAEEYVERVATRLRERGLTNVSTSVWYGPPAPAIVEAAEIGKVDLIVMSTHGRSGLGRLILGSVAESVLRGTHTPILLLRPAGAPVAAFTAGKPVEKEIAHV